MKKIKKKKKRKQHSEALFQEPGKGNLQEAGNVSLLQGRRDNKLQCVSQTVFDSRRLLIQQEASSSAQRPKFQVREL